MEPRDPERVGVTRLVHALDETMENVEELEAEVEKGSSRRVVDRNITSTERSISIERRVSHFTGAAAVSKVAVSNFRRSSSDRASTTRTTRHLTGDGNTISPQSANESTNDEGNARTSRTGLASICAERQTTTEAITVADDTIADDASL